MLPTPRNGCKLIGSNGEIVADSELRKANGPAEVDTLIKRRGLGEPDGGGYVEVRLASITEIDAFWADLQRLKPCSA